MRVRRRRLEHSLWDGRALFRVVGYLACVWAFAFAALSFYWAIGGTAGGATIGPDLQRLGLTRDPGFVAILWATGVLKVIVGLLALALTQPWGRRIPSWTLLPVAWCAGVIMALYEGLASLIQHALMVAGIIATPSGLGSFAARWHLLFWDPWWLLGGLLILLAAWSYSRAAAVQSTGQRVR